MKLLGLSGSLRVGSTNTMLLREAARIGGIADFSLADMRLPLYDGDLEAEGMPESVSALADQVRGADAVVIGSPEYNKTITPVLKNGLDWLSRFRPMPLSGKPVAVLSASAGIAGGQRAKSQVFLTLLAHGVDLVANPEVNLGQSSDKFDAEGRLTDETAERLTAKLMEALAKRV